MSEVKQFGPFELLHKIGAGGMAETFLSRVQGAEPGAEFVLKRILPEISGDPESEQAFVEEAELAASLKHPNIVSSLPAGSVEGRTYIPMEFIFGDDLRNVVQKSMARRKIPPDRFFIGVVAQAARGLAHAHEQKDEHGEPLELVHRDVSPPNIMIGFDGIVRMVDFGIARLRPGASSVRTGQLKGKFAYMSPEQALGINVDNRSDIFCLGIVLYELLTRKRLFRDDTALKTVRNVSRAQVQPPTEIRPTVHRDIEPIVLKALSRTATDRYQTADEFADALEGFLEKHGGPVTQEEIASIMKETCGDTIDVIKQVLGEDYAGPRPVDSLDIPELTPDPVPSDGDEQQDLAANDERKEPSKVIPIAITAIVGVAFVVALVFVIMSMSR
jgi:serine/threonine protein kinase